MCGRGFEQAKIFIKGLFLSNKGVMEKLGVTDFFFLWKLLGSQFEINKKLLGGYNILQKFVFNDNPPVRYAAYQRYAQWRLHIDLW